MRDGLDPVGRLRQVPIPPHSGRGGEQRDLGYLTSEPTSFTTWVARGRGYRPFGLTACFFAGVLVVGPYISANLAPVTGGYDASWGLLWLAIALAYVFLLQAVRHRTENALENVAIASGWM